MTHEHQSASPALTEQILIDLDPSELVFTDHPNRDESAFGDEEFWELVKSIRAAGGNVQPVKVRLKSFDPVVYQVVYGHRRVLACKRLGLKVKAIIEPVLSDEQVVMQRISENSSRVAFRPIELGKLAAYAVDRGLFKSLRAFAAATDIDVSLVSKAHTLAQMPADILAAFPSLLELQYKDAKPLADAFRKNAVEMAARAANISQLNPRPGTSAVLKLLTSAGEPSGVEPFNIDQALRIDSAEVGTVKFGRSALTICLKTPAFSSTSPDEFKQSLEAWLRKMLLKSNARRNIARKRASQESGTDA
jgi:ParB family transcriptional regulator, chromosome partitioning protein